MKCWFCTIRDAISKHALPFEMYGDVDAQKTPSETKVKYNVRHVEIPRCADCHSRHRHAMAALIAAVVLFLSVAAAVILAVLNTAPEWLWGLWAGASAGLLIGVVLTRQATLRGTLSTYFARKNYPEVKELSEKGYRFGRRPKATMASAEDNDDQD